MRLQGSPECSIASGRSIVGALKTSRWADVHRRDAQIGAEFCIRALAVRIREEGHRSKCLHVSDVAIAPEDSAPEDEEKLQQRLDRRIQMPMRRHLAQLLLTQLFLILQFSHSERRGL